MNTLALRNRGRYLRQRMPQEGKDIAIDATIRAAAPYQKARTGSNAIKVKSEDIREKERVGKTSAVVLFVVDASGSMGAMQGWRAPRGQFYHCSWIPTRRETRSELWPSGAVKPNSYCRPPPVLIWLQAG